MYTQVYLHIDTVYHIHIDKYAYRGIHHPNSPEPVRLCHTSEISPSIGERHAEPQVTSPPHMFVNEGVRGTIEQMNRCHSLEGCKRLMQQILANCN